MARVEFHPIATYDHRLEVGRPSDVVCGRHVEWTIVAAGRNFNCLQLLLERRARCRRQTRKVLVRR